MTSALDQLGPAIDRLGSQRRPLGVALAELRDSCARRKEHRLAEVVALLTAAMFESLDRERDAFRELVAGLQDPDDTPADGGSRP